MRLSSRRPEAGRLVTLGDPVNNSPGIQLLTVSSLFPPKKTVRRKFLSAEGSQRIQKHTGYLFNAGYSLDGNQAACPLAGRGAALPGPAQPCGYRREARAREPFCGLASPLPAGSAPGRLLGWGSLRGREGVFIAEVFYPAAFTTCKKTNASKKKKKISQKRLKVPTAAGEKLKKGSTFSHALE